MMVHLMSPVPSVSNLSGSSSGFPGPVSPVSGQEEKQCRYPTANNNLGPDPVMNYAASLATASSPGTNIAAAAHFYQQQVSQSAGAAGHLLLFRLRLLPWTLLATTCQEEEGDWPSLGTRGCR